MRVWSGGNCGFGGYGGELALSDGGGGGGIGCSNDCYEGDFESDERR